MLYWWLMHSSGKAATEGPVVAAAPLLSSPGGAEPLDCLLLLKRRRGTESSMRVLECAPVSEREHLDRTARLGMAVSFFTPGPCLKGSLSSKKDDSSGSKTPVRLGTPSPKSSPNTDVAVWWLFTTYIKNNLFWCQQICFPWSIEWNIIRLIFVLFICLIPFRVPGRVLEPVPAACGHRQDSSSSRARSGGLVPCSMVPRQRSVNVLALPTTKTLPSYRTWTYISPAPYRLSHQSPSLKMWFF